MTQQVINSDDPQLLRQARTYDIQPQIDDPIYFVDVNADYNGRNALTVYDEAAIRQRMMNVLSVIPGQEPFEPLFGSLLPFDLFEPVNSTTAFKMEFDTIEAVDKFMRREITVIHSECRVEELVAGDGYLIDLPFYIKKIKRLDRLRFKLIRPQRSI